METAKQDEANRQNEVLETAQKDDALNTVNQHEVIKTSIQDDVIETAKQDEALKTTKQDEVTKTTKQDEALKTTKQDEVTKTAKQDVFGETVKQDDTKTVKQDEFCESAKRDEVIKTAKRYEVLTVVKQDGLWEETKQDNVTKTDKPNKVSKAAKEDDEVTKISKREATKIAQHDEVLETAKQDEITKIVEQNEVSKTAKQDELTKTAKKVEVTEVAKGNEVIETAKQDKVIKIAKQDKVTKIAKHDEVNNTTKQDKELAKQLKILQISTQNLRTDYFYKLNLGLEHGVELLSVIFHNKYNDPNYIGAPEDEKQLNKLMSCFKQHKEKALLQYQWKLLCPPNSQTSHSKEWDATLLSSVIKKWPKNIPQLQNVLQVPQQLLDIVDEIREKRNEVKHKRLCDLQDKATFDKLWRQLRDLLARGDYQNLLQFDAIESGALRFYTDKIVVFLERTQKNLENKFKYLQKEMNGVKNQTMEEELRCKEQIDDVKMQISNMLSVLEQPCKEISEKQEELVSTFSNLNCEFELLSNRVSQMNRKVDKMEKEQEKQKQRADNLEDRIEGLTEQLEKKSEKSFLDGLILEEVSEIHFQERSKPNKVKRFKKSANRGVLDKILRSTSHRKRKKSLRKLKVRWHGFHFDMKTSFRRRINVFFGLAW